MKLNEVIGAGEPLNPEVIERVRAGWGLTLRDGYGQTESTCMVGNPPGLEVRAGSMGQPMPGYRMVLLDTEDREADEGELAVTLNPAPTGLMAGYAGDAEKTAAALGGSYYRTSDVARRDADGYYWYVGRADDVFKASDYRISPFELESALLEHPLVAEAAVVPSPDAHQAGGAQGLRRAQARAMRRRATRRWTSCASCAAGSAPTSACAASSLPSCRRPSPARSAACSCARPRTSAAPAANAGRWSSGKRTSTR